MTDLRQKYNSLTGRWEPPTVNDQLNYMSAREKAHFFAETFSNGYGEEMWYTWLNSFDFIGR